MAFKKPSDTQIQLMFKITKALVEKVQEHSSSFKHSSTPAIIAIVAALVILAGCIGWLIVMNQITPLMIYLALLVPIFCLGIAEQSKTISSLNKEFAEYSEAMNNFVKLIGDVTDERLTDEEKALGIVLAGLINSDTKVSDDLTYGEIRELPQYKNALAYAISLAGIGASLENAKEEGEDVAEILEEIELPSEQDAKLFENTTALYDAIQNTEEIVEDKEAEMTESGSDEVVYEQPLTDEVTTSTTTKTTGNVVSAGTITTKSQKG